MKNKKYMEYINNFRPIKNKNHLPLEKELHNLKIFKPIIGENLKLILSS